MDFSIGLALTSLIIVVGTIGCTFCCTSRREPKQMGLRKPGTEPGTWKGAWVACRDEKGKVVTAIFEDNMDFIGPQNTSWKQAMEQKTKLQEDEGWEPMTREDIRKTAGI
jgi:hypothetical protein